MGYRSLFIDEPFEPELCFSDDHGHAVPVHGHSGACQWLPKAAGLMRGRDPEAYVIGESPDIWNSRFLHMGWHWDWSVMRSEVFRYVLPESLQSWPIDGLEHGHQVGKAFSQGFVLALYVGEMGKTLIDAPDFAQRVRRLADLRRRTAAFTMSGRFLDRAGLTVDADTSIAAHVYDGGDRLAVVIGETSEGASGGGRAELRLDHGRARARCSGRGADSP
jgi:hypothetical protein